MFKTVGEDLGNTFESTSAKKLADLTPDGSVDDVAKSLQSKTMSKQVV